ncbi:MAG: DUF4232 domain-containing protein [Actinobacteria bacterium]|uniref:Unannotated protein n=1 Tax=freshwater metagenome TaxID=449393 RepID=A0A6J6NDU2_9ZZZZ|nr:DUF4232 domain-containing protein [Actinomycetota bacterium]
MRNGVLVLAAIVACGAFVSLAPGSSRASAALPCQLALEFGSRTGDPGNQFQINLVVVNKDFVTCRLTGFPAVELIGPVDPLLGSIFTLPEQSGRSQVVALRPGQRAHAVLTVLPPDRQSAQWAPGYVRVVVQTGAGPSFAMALPWRFGAVLRQDGASHPGTYIGPLRSGAG